MTVITVCIGSACHLCGAYGVLNAFKSLIEKYQVQASVDIEGSFCQGHCTEGVVVKIDGEILTNVTKDLVHEIFMNQVLGR